MDRATIAVFSGSLCLDGDAVALQSIMESALRDAEDPGRFGAIALGLIERVDHLLALFALELADRSARVLASGGERVLRELEIVLGDHLGVGHEDRAHDDVAKLADVARPRIFDERLLRFGI